ncbi:MAG TPA: metalloregulator ArsR/SmtB family transcription factor [bacterium]|nr:metalloregulator ArsR/SmtB family transcription factor [bacterium]HOL35245.1 metalloregulator ArsR/SmtB family transcription factor [bacterium]
MVKIKTFFKALANENRLRVIKMLENNCLCVCEIKSVLGTSQPAVSRHLGILKRAGFLENVKNGEWVYYRVAETKNPLIGQLLRHVFNALENEKQSAKDRKKVKKLLKVRMCEQRGKRNEKKSFAS